MIKFSLFQDIKKFLVSNCFFHFQILQSLKIVLYFKNYKIVSFKINFKTREFKGIKSYHLSKTFEKTKVLNLFPHTTLMSTQYLNFIRNYFITLGTLQNPLDLPEYRRI